MSFDWDNYLVLADELHNNCNRFPNQEACLRAAVSRGYYAVFCTARNLARDKEGLTLSNTGSDHRDVKDFFRGCSDKDKKRVAAHLQRLRNYRNDADYKDNMPSIMSGEAAVALTLAKDTINLLQNVIYK